MLCLSRFKLILDDVLARFCTLFHVVLVKSSDKLLQYFMIGQISVEMKTFTASLLANLEVSHTSKGLFRIYSVAQVFRRAIGPMAIIIAMAVFSADNISVWFALT